MRVNQAVLAGFNPPPFAGEPVHVKQVAQLLRDRRPVAFALRAR